MLNPLQLRTTVPLSPDPYSRSTGQRFGNGYTGTQRHAENKRILKVGDKYILTSANTNYEPEEVVDADDDLRICGRVKGILTVH